MHPRELANMALTASSVADQEGFSATAEAFVKIAVAAWALPSATHAEAEVTAKLEVQRVSLDTPNTKLVRGKLLYT